MADETWVEHEHDFNTPIDVFDMKEPEATRTNHVRRNSCACGALEPMAKVVAKVEEKKK